MLELTSRVPEHSTKKWVGTRVSHWSTAFPRPSTDYPLMPYRRSQPTPNGRFTPPMPSTDFLAEHRYHRTQPKRQVPPQATRSPHDWKQTSPFSCHPISRIPAGHRGCILLIFLQLTLHPCGGRLTDESKQSIDDELQTCGRDKIDCLHITSWDADHCSPNELEKLFQRYQPRVIEYPGYPPHTETAKTSLKLIELYGKAPSTGPANSAEALNTTARALRVPGTARPPEDSDLNLSLVHVTEQLGRFNRRLVRIDPAYINQLEKTSEVGYTDLVFWPKQISSNNSNNNSTAKLFRTGSFNVLSLGDLEDEQIAALFRRYPSIQREVDILILAHHGSDGPFASKKFLKTVDPQLAICCSNFDNKYEHPVRAVRGRLTDLNIPLMSTKRGDVIVKSVEQHTGKYIARDLSTADTQKEVRRTSKKRKLLTQNPDTVRQTVGRQRGFGGFTGPRRTRKPR